MPFQKFSGQVILDNGLLRRLARAGDDPRAGGAGDEPAAPAGSPAGPQGV